MHETGMHKDVWHFEFNHREDKKLNTVYHSI